MSAIEVERKRGVAPADFIRDHLTGVGVPAVVTDAIDAWPAREKWTLARFKAAYGSDLVPVLAERSDGASRVTKLAWFVDFLGAPDRGLPGFWVDADSRPLRTAPAEPSGPYYLMAWRAFRRHPELYDDIAPAPSFVADWQRALDPEERERLEAAHERDYSAIYIGAEGTLSRLHQDYGHTHACLHQIAGHKHCVLYAPGDVERRTPYECVIGPGDTLFMPPDWWHEVRGLDPTITVSHNFFNDTNVDAHLSGVPSTCRSVSTGARAR